jgi:hypothetical protein
MGLHKNDVQTCRSFLNRLIWYTALSDGTQGTFKTEKKGTPINSFEDLLHAGWLTILLLSTSAAWHTFKWSPTKAEEFKISVSFTLLLWAAVAFNTSGFPNLWNEGALSRSLRLNSFGKRPHVSGTLF